MERIKNNLDLLKKLSNCNKSQRKYILQKGKKEFIFSICECVLNFINGNIKTDDETFEKLKKYKSTLRKLLEKSSLKKKKELFVQKGGFLQILLPSLITGISALIENLTKK